MLLALNLQNTLRFQNILGNPLKYINELLVTCLFVWLLPAQAQSNTIVVDGNTYNITLFEGQSFGANASILRAAPFWGSAFLANDFANAFASQIGVPDTSADLNAVYFGFQESTFYFGDQAVPTVNAMFVDENGGTADFDTVARSFAVSRISFANATSAPDAIAVPEINSGAISQAFLILFVLWLYVRRWNRSICN